MPASYDEIGRDYSSFRQPDERIARSILDSLGDAETVVNVGAGTGSYEPVDRPVIPIEPSTAMASQRSPDAAPAVLASAESLPLADQSVDAALGALTIHHWSDPEKGLLEMKRVARRRIVLLTIDPEIASGMWLLDDYFPEIARRDLDEFPSMRLIRGWLGGEVSIREVPVPSDCRDGFLLSFWSRPELVLSKSRRAATSGFARLPRDIEDAGVEGLGRDLDSGDWDVRYGELRRLGELDAGLRLVVGTL